MLREQKIAVLRHNNSDISAMSLECTHLGCTINVAGDIFVCPCHGSRFTLDGKVLTGPAKKNLKKIALRIDGENVII
jgi:cytochrome b6-f complex iron-sulfur subunit